LLAGTFKITLNASGASSSQFSTDDAVATVTMISVADPVPAPSLLSAKFNDGGSSITIQFDSATNQASKTTTTWDCSTVFIFTGASNSICSWVNNSAVNAVLDAAVSGDDDATQPLLTVSENVTLIAGLIEAACTSECDELISADEQSTEVLAATNPVQPRLVLVLPEIISACESLTVDATLSSGFGGRDWTSVTWGLFSATGNEVLDVSNYLNNFGVVTQDKIVIPNSLLSLSSFTYTLRLSVTNFLGQTASTSNDFSISDSDNDPAVSISGESSISMKSSKELLLYATGVVSGCGDTANSSISYEWFAFSNGVREPSLVSTSDSTRTFRLAPYALSVGGVYDFIVTASTVSPRTGIRYSSNATASVIVIQGDIVAVLSGGDERQVPIDASFSLDASTSFDEDTGLSTGLNYLWSCSYLTFDKYQDSCDDIFGSASLIESTLTVEAEVLESTDTYSISVLVYAESVSRSSTASVTITPTGSGAPVVTMRSTLTQFNANQQFSVSASVLSEESVKATWVALVAGSETSFESNSPLSFSFSNRQASVDVTFPVVVLPFSFAAGSFVSFRLYAEKANGVGTFSQITLYANAAPTAGSLRVNPSAGIEYETSFEFSAVGWEDNVDDYPLRYSFYYSVTIDSPALTLQLRSLDPATSSVLPQGQEDNDFALTIESVVADVQGASVLTYGEIVVTEAESEVDLSSYLQEQFESAVASEDLTVAFQAMNNVATSLNLVNCSAARPLFCGRKNREACYKIPNTRGPCLDGYI
jgi:hypothetical protein